MKPNLYNSEIIANQNTGRKKYHKTMELQLPSWLSDAHKNEIIEAVKNNTPSS